MDSLYQRKEEAELYGKVKFRASDLGVEKRNVETEEFTILDPRSERR